MVRPPRRALASATLASATLASADLASAAVGPLAEMSRAGRRRMAAARVQWLPAAQRPSVRLRAAKQRQVQLLEPGPQGLAEPTLTAAAPPPRSRWCRSAGRRR